MRNLLLTAVALALASCSSCDDKKESPAPSEPAVAAPTPGAPAGSAQPERFRRAPPSGPLAKFEPRQVQLNGQTLIVKPTRRMLRLRPGQLHAAGEPPPAPAGDGPAPQAAPTPTPAATPAPAPAPTPTPAPTPAP